MCHIYTWVVDKFLNKITSRGVEEHMLGKNGISTVDSSKQALDLHINLLMIDYNSLQEFLNVSRSLNYSLYLV